MRSPQGDEHGGRSEAPPPVVRRTAARAVLVDGGDAVLLMSGRDPSVPDAPEFWITPGGGAEPGETLADAARREVYEEVGHVLGDVGPVVWQRTNAFEFDGRSYVQEESYYVVRTAHFEPRRVAWTDFEARMATGWSWWQLRELEASGATVYPPGLVALVGEWLRDGPPPSPRRID